MKYLILCKSLTNAQRASLLLERRGLSASVVKAPQHLRENGCGYALSLYRRLDEAVSLLQNNSLLTGSRIENYNQLILICHSIHLLMDIRSGTSYRTRICAHKSAMVRISQQKPLSQVTL